MLIERNELVGIGVTHSKYGAGEIIESKASFSADFVSYSLLLKIKFSDGSLKYVAGSYLDFGDERARYEATVAEVEECKKEKHQAYLDKREADKKAAAEAKAKAIADEKLAKSIANVEASLKEGYRKPSQNDIMWLAQNMNSIEIRLPDKMDSWFVSKFGNLKRTVVSTATKTSGGNEKQWTVGMKLGIKKSSISDLPASLKRMYRAGYIRCTAFVWDLIANHGFKVGEKQDLSVIY